MIKIHHRFTPYYPTGGMCRVCHMSDPDSFIHKFSFFLEV